MAIARVRGFRLSGAVLVLLLAPGIAGAQVGFRVTHSVGQTTPTHVEVSGTVTNEARGEAIDVSVTVQAVGANGKVVARGISFVSRSLAPGAAASFVAKVPVVPGIASYRAVVSSYRFVQSFQNP